MHIKHSNQQINNLNFHFEAKKIGRHTNTQRQTERRSTLHFIICGRKQQLMSSTLERENSSNVQNHKHTQANSSDGISKGSNEFVFFL